MLKLGLVVLLLVVGVVLGWCVVSYFYPDVFLRSMPVGLCEAKLSADKPNWVSSLVAPSDPHYVAPLPDFKKSDLIQCVKTMPPKRTYIEAVGEHLQGYRRTPFWGFTDWFCITEKGDITASATLGHSDFGVNRHWVASLRSCLSHLDNP